MDFVSILLLVLGVVLLAGLVGWLGFIIPPRKFPADLGENNTALEETAIPRDLPLPVRNYFEQYFSGAYPVPRTVVAHGHGRFRVRRLPLFGWIWAPLAWQLYLAPGQAFVWRMRLYWFHRLVVDGGESYIQGHGRYLAGRTLTESEGLDRSERTLLWLYTLIFAPGAMLAHPGAAWQPIGDHTARLLLTFPDEILEFTLYFDDETSGLKRIETIRCGSRGEVLYPYQICLRDEIDLGGDNKLPSHFATAWEGDIYARYQTDAIAMNGPIAEAIKSGIEG